jgi:hypothetical protein
VIAQATNVCGVDGCDRGLHSHGLCSAHGHRLARYGDPLGAPEQTTVEDRFWSKVDRRGSDECWLWQSTRDPSGYGRFSVGGTAGSMLIASRVAWAFTHGPISSEDQVLHRCDNPGCVNPDHLFLGTPRINSDAKVAKGRHAFGERNGNAKLTDEHVRAIRLCYAGGAVTQRTLASDYGVAQSIISGIVNDSRWRHVE